MAIDNAAGGGLRKLRPEEAWETIKDLAQYEEEEWNNPILSKKGIPNYINATLEHELGSMERQVESLMESEVLLDYELVQNGCAFHELMFEDPIQHLKDFLRIVDSIDLNGATRNTTRLRLFCFSLCDPAINLLDRLPAGSISTWDDLTTHFLAQFFPPGRTAKLQKRYLDVPTMPR
nr:zinc finger, CCHC-type [Tanacetum cinerariifolium]